MIDLRLVLDMHQSGGENLLIDGSGGAVYSKPIALDRFNSEIGGVTAGAPTEIGFNIHGIVGTLAGSWQAVNATADADFAEASTKWGDIDGGDLAQWLTSSCSVIKAPYTHIRAKVTAGKCKIALTSSAPIREIEI